MAVLWGVRAAEATLAWIVPAAAGFASVACGQRTRGYREPGCVGGSASIGPPAAGGPDVDLACSAPWRPVAGGAAGGVRAAGLDGDRGAGAAEAVRAAAAVPAGPKPGRGV